MFRIKNIFLVVFLFGFNLIFFSQTITSTLIKADKLFIKHQFVDAAMGYERYLKNFPKDYYASRQAAICYKKTNNQSQAIDHWPNVIESSKVTDSDRLDYAKCLLANYRIQDAKMMINFLRTSSDKAIAAWGLAYSNTDQFYQDSASTRVIEVIGINTTEIEFSPVLVNDKIIYVSEKNKKNRFFVSNGNQNHFEIKCAIKKDETHFTVSKNYADKIKIKGLTGLVSLSADETTLYFSKSVSSTKMNVVTDSKFYKYQIFYSNPNSEQSKISSALTYNSAEYDCMHPSISKDGLKLYFASDMKGTFGGKDIFVCEFINGAWSKPKNLGGLINTPGDEVFPTITEEGILYFASDAKPGLGGFDIFYAEPNKDAGTFFSAKNAGAPINTQFNDYGVYILKGGKAGYFSSNRKNNFQDDDIYYFVKE